MLTVYGLQDGRLKCRPGMESSFSGVTWIDLLDPTDEERDRIGNLLQIDLPTRADMEEIEMSSRLYHEGAGTFMTATVLANSDTEQPIADVVSFILVRDKLITLRFIDPQSFKTFRTRCERGTVHAERGEAVLMALVDVIIDRMADILERIGADIDALSHGIFRPEPKKQLGSKDFHNVLRQLGRANDLNGKMRESLLTISRMLSFLNQTAETAPGSEVRGHINTLTRDIQSLQDHSSFLSGKLSYLLDATLGLINIDQNDIIKIMSVASIVLLPPTLIASIEGMNFKAMPELGWGWGYPLSLMLMVISAVVPYLWFKRRGWL
jgi:magnesium transporter